LLESKENPASIPRNESSASPAIVPPSEEKLTTVRGLTAEYLDYAKVNAGYTTYSFNRVVVLDFLAPLCGDGTPVDGFKPSLLKKVREEIVKSRRFCRRTANRCVNSIITIFRWGVENDLVLETTWRALKAVRPLQKGDLGTFEHEERQPVPDDVVRRTLPFMPPTLRAMVQLQRLLGMRPNEIFNMRVGDIDTTNGNGLWYYRPGSYKTSRHVGSIVFPLGKPEQELIAPYLVGKKPESAIFSPREAMAERGAERRANRKTKMSPSHATKNAERAAKPSYYAEFYNRDSYRNAIKHAVAKANRQLPDDERIPNWYPYLLRNSTATDLEAEVGLDAAQAQLGHTSANMTRRYSKAQLRIREELAKNRRNPFEEDGKES
jgi:integrase